jgi:uncharacterized repeat protein (TIGR01451 family)
LPFWLYCGTTYLDWEDCSMKRIARALGSLGAITILSTPQLMWTPQPVRSQVTSGALCATPGKDGSPTNLSGVVNTYYPGTATANAGSTTISIGTATGNTTAPIKKGDLLLVIQMQDSTINFSNSDSYGDGTSGGGNSSNTAVAPTSATGASGASNLNNAGRYEYVIATADATATAVAIQSSNGGGLRYKYTQSTATNSQGQQTFQVVRVPQYRSVTMTSGLTASPWNGSTGGILAIDVVNTINLGNNTTVNLNGLGFRGGGGRQLGGDSTLTTSANTTRSLDYVNLATNPYHASKGEGIAGTPRYVYDDSSTTVTNTGSEGYPGGSFGRGAPGNAGGGGTDSNPRANDENSGGGGGGNGGNGGLGGQSWNSQRYLGGFGGIFASTFDRLVLGGGGGAGTRNNGSGVFSSGGRGGGIAMIRAKNISGSGTIAANGTMGVEPVNDGGGGGGAGGSVSVLTANGSLAGLTIQINGANGTKANNPQNGSGSHGPGGGGGGGVAVVPSTSGASILKNGGTNGTTQTNATPNTIIDYGATPGQLGKEFSTTLNNIPGASSGTECSTLTLSGTVFYDVDGSQVQNGTENSFQDGGLNAVLVNSHNVVVDSVVVGSNGSYSFSNVSVNQTYTVRLSTTPATVAQTPPTATLSTGWSSTGENLNGTIDNTVDTILSVPIAGGNISGANFGLTFPVSPMAKKIVINEVLYRQSKSGTILAADNDEFIELYNASSQTIDLSGWKLIDGNLIANSTEGASGGINGSGAYIFGSTTGNPAIVTSGTTVLAPNQYAVIWIGSQGANTQATGATFQAWLGKSPRLNDDGDDVWLYDSQTKIVDYIAYGSSTSVNTPPPASINLWNSSNQTALAGADDGQSISLTPNGQDGDTSACWEQTTTANANNPIGSPRCSTYLPTRDTDSVTIRTTSVGMNNNGILSNILLVKRITRINDETTTLGGDNLSAYKQDDAYPYDDNTVELPITHTFPDTNKWPGTVGKTSSTFLLGGINGGSTKPNDVIEYTIYFLSNGYADAKNTQICDRIPKNLTFIPNAFNSESAASGGGTGDRGILVSQNGTFAHTNIADGDQGQYYPPEEPLPASCGTALNDTGAVVVKLGNVPFATGQGTPNTSYGYVRFRTRIN